MLLPGESVAREKVEERPSENETVKREQRDWAEGVLAHEARED